MDCRDGGIKTVNWSMNKITKTGNQMDYIDGIKTVNYTRKKITKTGMWVKERVGGIKMDYRESGMRTVN